MEQIKDIIGFEGYYKITSGGRIIRLAYKRRFKNGIFKDVQESELAIRIGRTYPNVSLYSDTCTKTITMHRLMAIHFIPNDNPDAKEVNHKNKNRFDYSLENLEWVTRSQNIKHAWGNENYLNTPDFQEIPKSKVRVKLSPETVMILRIAAINKGMRFKHYVEQLLEDKANELERDRDGSGTK